MLANKCCKLETPVCKLTMQNATAEIGRLASRSSLQKVVIMSYYDSLAYVSLRIELSSEQQYEKRCMEATTESYWKWTAEYEEKASVSSGQENFL